jgi:hypothetical protein
VWQKAAKALVQGRLPIVNTPSDQLTPVFVRNWLSQLPAVVDNGREPRGGIARILNYIFANDADFENWFGRDCLPTRNVGGRTSVSEQVSDTLNKMQAEGWDMSLPYKRLAEQIAQRNNTKLGERNWNERTITRHVSKWFCDNR